jgi:hypothetical protein
MNFRPKPRTAVSRGDRLILSILNMDTLFTLILESSLRSASSSCCRDGRIDLDSSVETDFGFLFLGFLLLFLFLLSLVVVEDNNDFDFDFEEDSDFVEDNNFVDCCNCLDCCCIVGGDCC